jgi:hypothetical protein
LFILIHLINLMLRKFQQLHILPALILILFFSGSCKKESDGKPKYYAYIAVDGKNISVEREELATASNEDFVVGGIGDNGTSIVAHKQCGDIADPECFDLAVSFSGTEEGSFDGITVSMSMFQNSVSYDYKSEPNGSNDSPVIVQVTDIHRSTLSGQVGSFSGKLTGTVGDNHSSGFVPITIEFRVPDMYY